MNEKKSRKIPPPQKKKKIQGFKDTKLGRNTVADFIVYILGVTNDTGHWLNCAYFQGNVWGRWKYRCYILLRLQCLFTVVTVFCYDWRIVPRERNCCWRHFSARHIIYLKVRRGSSSQQSCVNCDGLKRLLWRVLNTAFWREWLSEWRTR